ncbi:hypothetical protein PQR34_13190 [Paraburkholderia sediminicola]|uniref:hypothetical protein n=1 Tax=Paraburkholderia sediminicola TaxID=458836 RepID=UPI0038B89662
MTIGALSGATESARAAPDAQDAPAASAAPQPGHARLGVAVDGQQIDSIDQLRQMIAQADDSVSLLIERDGEQMSVPVDLG